MTKYQPTPPWWRHDGQDREDPDDSLDRARRRREFKDPITQDELDDCYQRGKHP